MWVVDSGDRLRVQDCKDELHKLLTEDVGDDTLNVYLGGLSCFRD